PLKAGAIVLADRYIYTAFARDGARGVSPYWVRTLYRIAVKPTISFYFRVPLEVSLKRIMGARAGLKYYEAGMDLELSDDIEESFKIFQGMIAARYEEMVSEFGLTVIDATRSIEEQQEEVRTLVVRELKDVPRHPVRYFDFDGGSTF
ncbi:MAG TPA: thymidylate kinase, partial [Blastocatellia bacterium]|nr:thymidylate kinase [Blastocatellia bacterium]